MKSKIVICLVLLCSTCMAQDDAIKSVSTTDAEQKLRAELVAFEPYLGTWATNPELKDGHPLWLYSNYSAGMNGNFVSVETFAKNEGGEVCPLFNAIWRWDQEHGMIVSHRFNQDGTYDSTELTVATGDDGRPAITAIWTTPGSPVAVQQTMKLIDEKSYHWEASTSVTSENPIMAGIWKKQP